MNIYAVYRKGLIVNMDTGLKYWKGTKILSGLPQSSMIDRRAAIKKSMARETEILENGLYSFFPKMAYKDEITRDPADNPM